MVTAAGTVILAIVTYLAVRGGDRTAQAAHRTADAAQLALDLQTRVLLVPARRDDPAQHVVFHDGHYLRPDVAGGMAVVEDTGEQIYMGIALRNVGLGLALLYGWNLSPGLLTPETPPEDFKMFTPMVRALHVPPGEVGYWQARAREKHRTIVREATAAGTPITVDLLYGNEEGGQGRITRFHLRTPDDRPHSEGERPCEVARHWSMKALEGSWPEQQGRLRLVTKPDLDA